MTQTRLGSLIEAVMNVAIGFSISFSAQLLLFPLYGIHASMTTNLWLGAWFTAISIARSYIIRRWFNGMLHKAAGRLARE